MTKKKHGVAHPASDQEAQAAPLAGAGAGPAAGAGETESGVDAAAGTSALVEPAAEALRRVEAEAAEWKDRCLRAAADLENFKKRSARERTETWGRAQADLIARALDVVDDLARVAALDPGQTTAQVLHEGVGLVERKLLKVFEGVGLERLDPTGQAFDPNLHEAVMMQPAPSREADHTVGSVLQLGYRLNGVLLRPARVAVYAWTEPAAAGKEGGEPGEGGAA